MSDVIDISDARDGSIAIAAEEFCAHRRIIVSKAAREVGCRDCGLLLDPFDILLDYANRDRVFASWRGALGKIKAELAVLKREERNVKARLSRAQRRLDSEAS